MPSMDQTEFRPIVIEPQVHLMYETVQARGYGFAICLGLEAIDH